MTAELAQLFSGMPIPQAGYFISAGGKYIFAVRRKRDPRNRVWMSHGEDLIGRLHVPQPCGIVTHRTGGEYLLTVRRKGYAIDVSRVSDEFAEFLTALYVPQM